MSITAQWARAHYDHRVDAVAVGSVALRGDQLPKGAVILDVIVKVDQAPDSTGHTATVALKAESSADLLSATQVSSAPWSTTGAKHGTLTATSSPVVTTKRRPIVATVATQALTAGKFTVLVKYLKP